MLLVRHGQNINVIQRVELVAEGVECFSLSWSELTQ